jgi:hypothetical protein
LIRRGIIMRDDKNGNSSEADIPEKEWSTSELARNALDTWFI